MEKLEDKILTMIFNITVLKNDFIQKYEKIDLNNKDLLELLFLQDELFFWLMLMRLGKKINKEKKKEIERLLDNTYIKVLQFYGKYLIDYVDDKEQKEIEKILKNVKNDDFVPLDL
ncbi:hypothetical protein [Caldisphaera sp.]|uniref:hypothetical protein n=1 Tax=Caldisphaera sp. TaxID=2060322 RepID=UPI0025C3DC66|nr:hypothetical protein [Caldisphaera sp.]